MRVEISGMDARTLNRARYHLDEAGIRYETLAGTPVMEGEQAALALESDSPRALRDFCLAALGDSAAKVYR